MGTNNPGVMRGMAADRRAFDPTELENLVVGIVDGRAVIQGARSSAPTDFGPVTGDATTVLQLAVDEAKAGSLPLEVTGDLLISGNITDFWDAFPIGRGSITREGVRFEITPRITPFLIPTNHLYVDAGIGADSNDGLSPGFPIKTLGKLNGILRRLTADQTAGAMWQIHLAGTFPSGQKFPQLQDFPLTLEFVGEPLVSGEPVTIIRKGTGDDIIGMWFEPGRTRVHVRNIRFEDFTVGFNGYGLLMKGGGLLRAYDCRAVNCDTGFAAIKNVDFNFDRCYTDSTIGTGFSTQYNSSGAFVNCETFGCDTGYSITRNSVVHIDYCHIYDCETGVSVDMGSRANSLESHYKRNTLGVRASGAGEWVNASSYFYDGTADANTENFANYGVGRETRLYSMTARNEFRIGQAWAANPSYETPVVVTGTASNTLVYTGTALGEIPSGFFTVRGKRIRVEVMGTATLSANATLSLYAQVPGSSTVHLLEAAVLKSGMAGGAFKAEFTIWSMTPTTQKTGWTVVASDASGSGLGSSSVDYSSEKLFRLYVSPGSTSDVISVHSLELFLMG